MSNKAWLDPTPEMLETEEFDVIWQAIKTWDINVPEVYEGYCGANGNHVRAILDALKLNSFTKKIHTLESKLISLKGVVKTQSTKGNWDADEYMRGLTNGLIMAEAIMDDKEPKYFEANYPEKNREEKLIERLLTLETERLIENNRKLADEIIKLGGTING